jgi:monoamine oxidase
MPSQNPTSDQLDVAIVGGGMSGLYTAWRLLGAASAEGRELNVKIYEMSDRVGGRLLTWLPAGPEVGLRAELGGMRFFEEQELVWGLMEQLGLGDKIVPFYVQGENLRLLLRGVSMPLDTDDPTQRYFVEEKDKDKAPDEVLKEVIDAVLAANVEVIKEKLEGREEPKTRKDWDEVKPYLEWRGRKLFDLGFWNLFSEVRNAETYQYITDAFGYYSLASNWNAAEAMQTIMLDFNPHSNDPNLPPYRTLHEGYESLPRTLAEAVENLGGQIVLDTRLVSFEAPEGGNTTATFAGPNGTFEVEAGSLVLGMPRRSLELLSPSKDFDLQGNRPLKRLIETVNPVPAFKLFLFFEERWWEKMGITHGRSICDLPIRQTYYFAPESGGGEYGVLMASYDDKRTVEYWEGLVPPEWQGLVPPKQEREEGRAELRQALIELVRGAGLEAAAAEEIVPDLPPHMHQAPQLMIDHAMEQLAVLHGVPNDKLSEIPQPKVGGFSDWAFDPFGGGWNFWNPQLNVEEAMTQIKAPLGEDRRVYIVGDGYSGIQGWVEGALTTTELVLEKHFDLPRPPWLAEDYYLGW